MTSVSVPEAAVRFFYDHAGFAYDPSTETPEQGRERCALELAKAEMLGSGYGLAFEWLPDVDSHGEWVCLCYSPEGEVVGSLGGIDVEEGVTSPWLTSYGRVVQAELAQEFINSVMTLGSE